VLKVLIHPAAAAEYAAAFVWYCSRSRRAAVGFEQAVEQAVRLICMHPEAPPLRDARHRYCKVRKYPYGIVYRLTGDNLRVVAIAHDRQLPEFWLQRD
jgi:plasmid stabilization system protein ParE